MKNVVNDKTLDGKSMYGKLDVWKYVDEWAATFDRVGLVHDIWITRAEIDYNDVKVRFFRDKGVLVKVTARVFAIYNYKNRVCYN